MTSILLAELGITESESTTSVVTATIESATPDVAICRLSTLSGSLIGALPASSWYANIPWVVGESYQLLRLDNSTRPTLSATDNRLVTELFAGICPEIRSGEVRIMGVARSPGVRCKVAVAATHNSIDPIATCVGRSANRVRYVSQQLAGERVDVVAWHPDPAHALAAALAPAAVEGVDIDGSSASVLVARHQMSAAVGGQGLNSQLAGELLGLDVTIVPH